MTKKFNTELASALTEEQFNKYSREALFEFFKTTCSVYYNHVAENDLTYGYRSMILEEIIDAQERYLEQYELIGIYNYVDLEEHVDDFCSEMPFFFCELDANIVKIITLRCKNTYISADNELRDHVDLNKAFSMLHESSYLKQRINIITDATLTMNMVEDSFRMWIKHNEERKKDLEKSLKRSES